MNILDEITKDKKLELLSKKLKKFEIYREYLDDSHEVYPSKLGYYEIERLYRLFLIGNELKKIV